MAKRRGKIVVPAPVVKTTKPKTARRQSRIKPTAPPKIEKPKAAKPKTAAKTAKTIGRAKPKPRRARRRTETTPLMVIDAESSVPVPAPETLLISPPIPPPLPPPIPPPIPPLSPPVAGDLEPAEPIVALSAPALAPPRPRIDVSPPEPQTPRTVPFDPTDVGSLGEVASAAATASVTPPDNGQPDSQPDTLLFEVAWEVCWQLGGIYTVLRTKAPSMIERWGNRYCLIGPYNPRTAAVEFEEQPTEGLIRAALDRLRDAGIPCHYGRWLIPGRPRVILLDHRARFPKLAEDKYFVWSDHGISLPPSDGEVNEVVAFGFTVTEFFKELSNVAPQVRTTPTRILAHCHEWMGGLCIPRIAHLRLPVTTVFTTHATLLGRYLAGDNPHFYQHLPFLNPDAEAAKYQILPRHLIEKAAAHASTVFTTVSEVTAIEAEKLLGRAPDVILPNGINIRRFAAIHEFQNLHLKFKERIHEFVMGHFFPSYTFDLDRTLYFVTSGRYEYKNKGLDLFIESLARLNARLKQTQNPPTIVAFIVTRAGVRNINVGVLQSQMQLGDLRHLTGEVEGQIGNRIFMAVASGRVPTFNELIPEDAWVRLKRAIHAHQRASLPAIVTHDLADDANDPILNHLRHRGLFNSPDDPVKIIFHPEFVTATSPLIGLDYDQFVRGCHLGIFPSYYEPWGYTPMECVALGVPAVTTDLSGFGAYVQRHIDDYAAKGITVLERRNHSFDESAEQLVGYLWSFVQLNRRQRIELRNGVERLSETFDWSRMVRHYHEAHDLAMERTGGARPGRLEVRMV